MHAVPHVISLAQLPFASHVWSVVASLQCLAPGVHVVQALLRHTVSHVNASCHLPCASHVWSVLLSPGLHCLAFGAHWVQAPPTHAVVVQAGPLLPRCPLESQSVG
jgi:hypothetical protein